MDVDLNMATGGLPVSTSSPITTKGRLRVLFLYRQNILVLVLTLISFALVIYTSNSEFMDWPLFPFFTPLLTLCIVYHLIFFFERIFVRKTTKALYFLIDLKTSLFCFLCSILNLVCWVFYSKPDTNLIHQFINATLVMLALACTIWISKILSLKQLACQFHAHDFFEKMKQLIDQEYVLQTLLFGTTTIKFNIISDAIRKAFDQSEVDALFTRAVNKFVNGDARDIRETDLLNFMKKPDVAQLLRLFKAEESKSITQTSLKNWIVKVCKERKTLVDRLSHTNMAIKDLNYIINMNLLPLLTAVWFVLMGFETRVLLIILGFLATWLAPVLPTYKSIQEGIIFAFRMRWFDIGDCCLVDNEKMVVIDIGIFTTVFLKENNHTESFSNSSFATKSIQNLTRSSVLSETVEVYVDTKTSNEQIKDFESKIDEFLKSKPESWIEGHSLLVNELSKKEQKYALRVTHSTKFENFEMSNNQRSQLLLEVKKILKELRIEYLSVQ